MALIVSRFRLEVYSTRPRQSIESRQNRQIVCRC